MRRRKWRWRWRRLTERPYKRNYELHAYEEEVVLRELRARGGVSSAREWCSEEPERWRKATLEMTFVRLRDKGKVEVVGRSVRRINHRVYITTNYRERVGASTGLQS